jgi:ATP phosphoribosyltransferase
VMPDPAAALESTARFKAVAPFGTAAAPLVLHVPRRHGSECAAFLRTLGAPAVVIVQVADVYADNPLTPPLLAAIG